MLERKVEGLREEQLNGIRAHRPARVLVVLLHNLQDGEVVEDGVCEELAHLAIKRLRRRPVPATLARVGMLRQEREQLSLLVNEKVVDGGDAVVELLLKLSLHILFKLVSFAWRKEPLDELFQCLHARR